MPIGPEHVGGAAGAIAFAIEIAKQVAEVLRKAKRERERKKNGGSSQDKVETTTNAEFRGEIHEFKRQMIAEAELGRRRYHGLRTLVSTLIGINSERRAARHAGREFDTGVYDIDLREMERRLDEMRDEPLPQLSPPSAPRPPLLRSKLPPDEEGEPE